MHEAYCDVYIEIRIGVNCMEGCVMYDIDTCIYKFIMCRNIKLYTYLILLLTYYSTFFFFNFNNCIHTIDYIILNYFEQ